MAMNRLMDLNLISAQVVLKFLLKIIKLGLIIIHISYFMGLIWYQITTIV
jgi:hypothetical protein